MRPGGRRAGTASLVVVALAIFSDPSGGRVPAAASAVLTAAPQSAAETRPFGFPPPGPSRRFSLEPFRAWAAAVLHHEPGVVDEPARSAARLTPSLPAVFADFAAIRAALAERRARVATIEDLVAKTRPEDRQELLLRRQDADLVRLPGWSGPVADLHALLELTPDEAARADLDRVLERAILLHTDVAVFDSEAASRSDRMQVVSIASVHFGVAMAFVDAMKRDAPDNRLPRQWYGAIGVFLRWHRDIGSGPAFMRRAVSQFPADADLRLLAGALHEFLASPTVQDPLGLKHDPSLVSAGIEDERGHLRTALEFERGAVERDPALAEARVRLGHITGQLGDHQRALDELKTALAGLTDPRLRYYAWLFAGQEHEALGRRDAARDAYRQALGLFPDAQSAAVAFGHLERRQGDNAAAVAAVLPVLAAVDPEPYDPWIDYYTGMDGQAERSLDRLRRAIRDRRPR